MPVPGELRLGVQPLEGAEQLVGVRHVESGAVVAHEEDRPAAGGCDAELDARVLALAA